MGYLRYHRFSKTLVDLLRLLVLDIFEDTPRHELSPI
jgi:hypothetical protein